MKIVLLCFPDLFSIQVWMSKMSDGIKDVRCRMSHEFLLVFKVGWDVCWMSDVTLSSPPSYHSYNFSYSTY